MLDQLRDRVVQILIQTHRCMLATAGLAGLQASMVHCIGRGTSLYLLVSDTSDQLFNLETEAEVVVTTETWQLHGLADIVQESTDLFSADQRQWHTVVRVVPVRLHLLPAKSGPANYAETIDFDR